MTKDKKDSLAQIQKLREDLVVKNEAIKALETKLGEAELAHGVTRDEIVELKN